VNKKLILASGSPRRIAVLRKFGYEFDVIKPEIDEKIEKIDDCLKAAEEKAKSINVNGIILACDTIVVLEGKILEKPKNIDEAREFLQKLSGKWHEVYTGYYIKGETETRKNIIKTEVKFAQLGDFEIELLLKYGNPLDKAGAYGIQDIAGLYILEIRGSYYNVVGIPIEYIYWDLKELGILPEKQLLAAVLAFYKNEPFKV
jgi:MAF protein